MGLLGAMIVGVVAVVYNNPVAAILSAGIMITSALYDLCRVVRESK